ncbi:MAG: DUF5119 domain-containing protein [Prevotella sp.]|nr:DUF5119 domain-containing protein [Prevotella sp.]
MKTTRLTLMALLLLATLSCNRMTLYDLEQRSLKLVLSLKLSIDVKIDPQADVDIDIETEIRQPEHMRACFYGVGNGNMIHNEYVGPTGGIISTPAGSYRMLVYSFGTEFTQIRNDGNLSTIEAFTSDITSSKSSALAACTRGSSDEPQGPIIYAPDHLLVSLDDVEIPERTSGDHDIVISTTASTIVKTYSFRVSNVAGAQYIKSVEAFVTNQSRSSFFGRGEISQEPATICFPVGVNRKGGYLYSTFNTFGKLPGESRSFLHILLYDSDGNEYHISSDITDQFDNEEHEIEIDEPIDIPTPSSGGGIAPTVDPWGEENEEVPIG